MSSEEQKNIEEHNYKIKRRQIIAYALGLIIGTLTAAGVYYGIKAAIVELGVKIAGISVENVNIRQDVRNINNRMDQIQSQSEIRYLEIKLDLEKKQDKRK